MDKMFLAKCIDIGIDIFASVLVIYILVRYILKKRKSKESASEDSLQQ